MASASKFPPRNFHLVKIEVPKKLLGTRNGQRPHPRQLRPLLFYYTLFAHTTDTILQPTLSSALVFLDVFCACHSRHLPEVLRGLSRSLNPAAYPLAYLRADYLILLYQKFTLTTSSDPFRLPLHTLQTSKPFASILSHGSSQHTHRCHHLSPQFW